MLKQSKETINSKKNYLLRKLLLKRKKKKKEILEEYEEEKKELEDKKKKQLFIPKLIIPKKEPIIQTNENIKSKPINKTEELNNNENRKNKSTNEQKNTNNSEQKPNLDIPTFPKVLNKEKDIIVNQPKSIEKLKNKAIKPKNDFNKPTLSKENNYNSKSNIKQKTISKVNSQEKEALELAIINEFEVILKDSQYELNKLITDFNILNKEVNAAVETKELEKTSDEIDELIQKLEEIKKELALLTNSATFKNIYKIHDPYLTNIIDEYKDSIEKNKDLLATVNQLENDNLYLSIINKITEFENEKDKFTNYLNNTKEEYQIRDEEFEKWKDNYIDIEKITKSLDELVNISDNKLKDIEIMVNKSVTITEIVETKIKNGLRIIGKTLLLMSLLKKNPTKQANAITAISVLTTFSLINDIIKPEKIITKRIETDLVDYRNMITNSINDVNDISILINNSISEINNLKSYFEKEFKQYQYDIPEYKDFIDKLNIIEKEMVDRKDNISKISNELSYQYERNDKKVKKYQNIS